MTTPAQEIGLIVGKDYNVTSDREMFVGTWTFERDDGTHLPFFHRQGKLDDRTCLYVDGTAETKFTPVEQDGEEENFNIDVKFKKGGVVDISISKKLTADQVAAVLKIVGV